MAERAHPEDCEFQDRWVVKWVLGLIPFPVFRRSPWKKGLIRRYEFCQSYVPGKRVLEIPCGVGWGTAMLRGARRLVGVDVSEEAIQYACEHFGACADFAVGNMESLQFPPDSFDLVLCLEGIEHVPEAVAQRFILESSRVLARNGMIILTSPIPDSARPHNPYHCREYERHELLAIVEPHFECVVCEVKAVGGVDIVYYVGKVRKDSAVGASA